jgi:hypothetical protein
MERFKKSEKTDDNIYGQPPRYGRVFYYAGKEQLV